MRGVARFSKSVGISVTEDLSKRTREARQEMRKYPLISINKQIHKHMVELENN